RLLAKYPAITICLEATGTYSMELSIALFDAGLRLMVVNPQASHNFAKVLGKHSKTDQVDADTLAQFAECMPFKPWQRPSDAQLALRAFARRIRTLTDDRTAAKNQLHATDFNQHAPKAVLKDVKQGITQLDKRIAALSRDAVAFIEKHKDLKTPYDLLITVKGIAASSAIAILGELLLIPKGLRAPQWVKFAGLDPKHFRSGSSVEKKPRISKAGNRHLRAALYMPALSAKTHDPNIKAYAEHLAARGKTPMQVVCAVMRKLLHAIHGMLNANAPFDGSRFYVIPEKSPLQPA
ncbi:MAG: IS110 family transposase, partial [Gammaproteobacteria bacterium]|nr:IS110 family transposase [Gammaproteobacteria bacterium]